ASIRSTTLTGRPGTDTDWQRLLSVAESIVAVATGIDCPLLVLSRPPNCLKPVPSNLSAETLNDWPETVNDAAIAPFAIPSTTPTTASDAGTIMMPNRFHRVRPCTWPFWESAIDPPSRPTPL